MLSKATRATATRRGGPRSGKVARACANERAFTLIELMTVVAIVGVLATLATFGVRKYVLEAKKAEASSMLVQIRAAEEAYKDETFAYLGASNFDAWHPTSTPGTGKRSWTGTTTSMGTMLNQLGVMPDGAVGYSYAVVAGLAGGSIPTIPTAKTFTIPAPTAPFYVAMAKADLNGDGQYTYALTYSETSEIYIEETF